MTPPRTGIWTLGGVLYLSGLLIVLTVGGLLADQQYHIMASSGAQLVTLDGVERQVPTPTPTTRVMPGTTPRPPETAVAQTREPAQPPPAAPSFAMPDLNPAIHPTETVAEPWTSTMSRIQVPAIGLDKVVVPVGWSTEEQEGQDVAVFEVDRYRVGHHVGTSNPGGGGNIVLAGHSGGRAYPFNDIYYLTPGDRIELWSADQVYAYVVSAHIVVDEVGQPLAKRLENARYIQPTEEEVVTMVACWPLTGKDKFKQRVIIQARPVVAPVFDTDVSSIRPR